MLFIIFLFLGVGVVTKAQDSSRLSKLIHFPDRLFGQINRKSIQLDEQINSQTEKYLKRLARQERKMQRKLSGHTDSIVAKKFSDNTTAFYQSLDEQMKQTPSQIAGKLGYSGHLDSLQTSIQFFIKNGSLSNQIKGDINQQSLNTLVGNLQSLQGQFGKAATIRQLLQDRKSYLKAQFLQSDLSKQYRHYQSELYYYQRQIEQYRDECNDPEAIGKRLVSAAKKIPLFDNFFKQNSLLAILFPTPEGYGTVQSLAGLQTRDQVQQMVQQEISSGGPNAQDIVQQNMDAAQGQMNQLKDKIAKWGNGGENIDMPQFTPNSQKVKSFLNRLEYGTTFQTQHSNYYFPATTDLGLTVGYRLNDKSVIGLGASYRMGWGSGIQHIALSGQGIGLRSYVDIKIKTSFYLSAGLEYNYQQPFSSLQQIKYLSDWQQSGLVGISKIVSIKSKAFKKTRIQLLWDFLSYSQLPQRQPLKFRIGYNF